MSENKKEVPQQPWGQQLFANAAKRNIYDPVRNNTIKSTSFSSYTKDQILKWLNQPSTNEVNLRKASIQMYQNSPHYRRFIMYYALAPLWNYVLEPYGFDNTKNNIDNYQKQFVKVSKVVEKMNLKHEMSKASIITLREGILYGVIWSGSDAWFIQRINPDWCRLTAVEDGVWMYAVDMSQIKESDLFQYPPEFTAMHNAYVATKQKYQEVPASISFCLKADETTDVVIPPWASVLPEIFDLQNYKELAEVAKEIENYKLINMVIPSDDQGVPTIDEQLAQKYYNQLAANVPSNIGISMSPMKLNDMKFDKSAAGAATDEIADAISRFWYDSGVSPLLFGDAANKSSTALNLSIKTDESIVFALIAQCERLINRHLKSISGSLKFKIRLLPVTSFNQKEWIGYYKEAATLGLPVKLQYAAVLGVETCDVNGLCFLENDVLQLNDKFIPLQSSYTQSSSAGRPQTDDTELSDEGNATRDNDKNG